MKKQNPESGDWNPGVRKLTVYDFIEAFQGDFVPERDFWNQVLERLCVWFEMWGAILLYDHKSNIVRKIFWYEAPKELSVYAQIMSGSTEVATRTGPVIPDEFERRIIENIGPYEVIEEYVPEELRNWNVRNYMLLRSRHGSSLSSGSEHSSLEAERIFFLGNAPEHRLFDQQEYGLWSAVSNLVSGGLARLMYDIKVRSERINKLANNPHIRIHQCWMELDQWYLLTGQYSLDRVASVLELALAHLSGNALDELINTILKEALPKNWDKEEDVREAAPQWSPEIQATFARAYLAIGNTDCARAILDIIQATKEDSNGIRASSTELGNSTQ